MSVVTTPLTYSAAEAAERIGPAVTADWLKKRAAAGEIPCTRSGKGRGRSGRLAFTEAHLAEILHIIERRPDGVPAPEPGPDDFQSVQSRGRRAS